MNNRIKKVISSIGVFFGGMISKAYAGGIELAYGICEPIEETQGIGVIISKIGKIATPIALFIIGLGVILSKKITNKVKAIVISVLVILAILGIMLMNYISTNF